MNLTCNKCGIEKDISVLYIRKNYTRCFECMSNDKPINKTKNPIIEKRNKLRDIVIQYIKINSDSTDHPLYEIVGASPNELKQHLESKFTEGMTWSNRGFFGWHIDHITPLWSAKDDESKLNSLCHYTNLQPLWRKDNLNKH